MLTLEKFKELCLNNYIRFSSIEMYIKYLNYLNIVGSGWKTHHGNSISGPLKKEQNVFAADFSVKDRGHGIITALSKDESFILINEELEEKYNYELENLLKSTLSKLEKIYEDKQ